MSNSSDEPLLSLPIAPRPPLADRLTAAAAALTLASTIELEGNTSRQEWLDRGLVELAGCRAALLAGSESIRAQDAARLVELQHRAASLLEQLKRRSGAFERV
jgi:hypothetical protein